MPQNSFPSDQITRFRPADEIVEVIVKYNGDIERVGAELNAAVERLSDNYAVLTLEAGQILDLYNYNEVEYIEFPKELAFTLHQNLVASCITQVQRESGFGLLGNGVICGIIDSGIDYTHPDFRNNDGSSRILYLWDQSLAGTPPAGFRSGSEYTNSQINEALNSADPYAVVPSRDYLGHGTAVTGIAAGGGRANIGAPTGVAPLSQLIIVKLGYDPVERFPTTTQVMRGLKYIIDRAQAMNMPCAINLSYGTNNGSHTGNSLFESFINDIALQWKTAICVAAGNEGTAGHHFAATLAEGENLIIDFSVASNIETLFLTLWKNFSDTINFELISPNGDSTGIIEPTTTTTTRNWDGTLVSVLYGQPTNYSTLQEVFFSLRGEENYVMPGLWRLVVSGEDIVSGAFDIWLPTVEQVTDETAFLQADEEMTITLPATVQNVISVGGYLGTTGVFSAFSGRGEFSGWWTKPDLVAPAENIVTAVPGGAYSSFSGTSMAAPFVTGSAALMMEWGIVRGNDPFLYGQRVKAFLQRGARRETFLTYPNPLWGYGRLCLNDTMNELTDYNNE